LTASGDKLKILDRGNFLMRLDDTKDMVVQALVISTTVMKYITLPFLFAIVVYHNLYNSTATDVQNTLHTAAVLGGDKLKILDRGNFLMRLDDTKDMVVQALVAQITVDRIIGLDCLRSNAGLIDLQNSMLGPSRRR
jgi:hypothetical protein